MTDKNLFIKSVLDILTIRFNDLVSCHKDDDCRTMARGVELAIDDVLNLFGGER